MQITREKNKLIVHSRHFDPKSTLECGQLFRFKASENGYIVYSADKACKVYPSSFGAVIEAEDIDYFYNYFDLSTDYSSVIASLSGFSELTQALNYGGGIRILRQNLVETIISFIISANNNIPRIKGIIERLCEKVGTNMGFYYAFPTLEQLSALTEDDYKALGCGFRANYLFCTVKKLLSEDFLTELVTLDTHRAVKKLCELKGIGAKVADCVLLFGLGHTDSYPVDTWIFKANKIAGLDTPQKVHEYYSARYGKFAGYAQQYIFYYGRENN